MKITDYKVTFCRHHGKETMHFKVQGESISAWICRSCQLEYEASQKKEKNVATNR